MASFSFRNVKKLQKNCKFQHRMWTAKFSAFPALSHFPATIFWRLHKKETRVTVLLQMSNSWDIFAWNDLFWFTICFDFFIARKNSEIICDTWETNHLKLISYLHSASSFEVICYLSFTWWHTTDIDTRLRGTLTHGITVYAYE